MDGRTIPLNKTLPRDLCPGGSRRTRPMTRTILSYPIHPLSTPFVAFSHRNLDRRLSPTNRFPLPSSTRHFAHQKTIFSRKLYSFDSNLDRSLERASRLVCASQPVHKLRVEREGERESRIEEKNLPLEMWKSRIDWSNNSQLCATANHRRNLSMILFRLRKKKEGLSSLTRDYELFMVYLFFPLVFGQESGLNRAIKFDVSEMHSVYGERAVYAVAQKSSDGGEGDIRRSGSIRRWKG